jgi:hypothetical protein
MLLILISSSSSVKVHEQVGRFWLKLRKGVEDVSLVVLSQ